MNTDGLALKAKVHSAKIPDQDCLKMMLKSARAGVSRLKRLWLDAGYEGKGKKWAGDGPLGLAWRPCASLRSPRRRRWRRGGPRSGSSRARR